MDGIGEDDGAKLTLGLDGFTLCWLKLAFEPFVLACLPPEFFFAIAISYDEQSSLQSSLVAGQTACPSLCPLAWREKSQHTQHQRET